MTNMQLAARLDSMALAAIESNKQRGAAKAAAQALQAGGPGMVLEALDLLDSLYTDVPDNSRGAKVLEAWSLIDRARVLCERWERHMGGAQEAVLVTDLQSTLVHIAARAPRGVAKGDNAEQVKAKLAAILKVLAAVKQTPVAMQSTRDGASDAWDRVRQAMRDRELAKTPKRDLNAPKELPATPETPTTPE